MLQVMGRRRFKKFIVKDSSLQRGQKYGYTKTGTRRTYFKINKDSTLSRIPYSRIQRGLIAKPKRKRRVKKKKKKKKRKKK